MEYIRLTSAEGVSKYLNRLIKLEALKDQMLVIL